MHSNLINPPCVRTEVQSHYILERRRKGAGRERGRKGGRREERKEKGERDGEGGRGVKSTKRA